MYIWVIRGTEVEDRSSMEMSSSLNTIGSTTNTRLFEGYIVIRVILLGYQDYGLG